ncbi:30S ribosomal protein S2 [Candidatus Uhrbacteria bacterium]|nr:30S ribosomal protein S2 [Candidatus Uhrbacteria bacterium]
MPTIPSLAEMLQAGVHFGHQSSRWHPKMEPYIFTERGGIHVINLEKTQEKLEKAVDFLRGVAARGGVILFVGTKRQASEIVKREAEACGMPYVNNRWLGGTLTNFFEIRKLIRRYKTLKDQQVKGELRKYTKKEQLWFGREIEELDRKVGGIQTVERMPDVVFIVDMKAEKTALDEARVIGTQIAALCDTNVNPDDVQWPIPANDDAVKGIDMMLRVISEAVQEGRKEWDRGAAERAAVKAKADAAAPATVVKVVMPAAALAPAAPAPSASENAA